MLHRRGLSVFSWSGFYAWSPRCCSGCPSQRSCCNPASPGCNEDPCSLAPGTPPTFKTNQRSLFKSPTWGRKSGLLVVVDTTGLLGLLLSLPSSFWKGRVRLLTLLQARGWTPPCWGCTGSSGWECHPGVPFSSRRKQLAQTAELWQGCCPVQEHKCEDKFRG